jgi:hypothetical protein
MGTKLKSAIENKLHSYSVAELVLMSGRLEEMKGDSYSIFSEGAEGAQRMIEKELSTRMDELILFALERVGVSID